MAVLLETCVDDLKEEDATLPEAFELLDEDSDDEHAAIASNEASSGLIFDLTAALRECSLDVAADEEAAVPDDFTLFIEDEGEEDDDLTNRLRLCFREHAKLSPANEAKWIAGMKREIKNQPPAAPLPDFYAMDDLPEDLSTLPALEYYPMVPEVEPVRLLVVHPHAGDPSSVVKCNLFPVSFAQEHYFFGVIRNTRGNKFLKGQIMVNNCFKEITRNLEVFLRNFRHPNRFLTVWIREICIDQLDYPEHKTRDWRDFVFSRASTMLNMETWMYEFDVRGMLAKERSFKTVPKEWANTTRSGLPDYFPIPLRTFTKQEMEDPDLHCAVIPHEYVPLDLIAEEIRLIVLLPSADPDAPLRAKLAHESIYGECVYHCLSYTWGQGDATEDLILNSQCFKIRKSLHDALRAIRAQGLTLTTIWVDAVNIDQENINERNHEVSRMHKIYERADCVLIWLGEATIDSDLAMDFVARQNVDPSSTFTNIDDDDVTELVQNRERAQSWSALYKLLQRPYFRRLWIVQELALASLPTALCGSKQIPWHQLEEASLSLQYYFDQIKSMCQQFNVLLGDDLHANELSGSEQCPNCTDTGEDHNMTLAHKLSWHREMRKHGRMPSFFYLCLLNRNTECTNPRDRIFALWNLAKEANKLEEFRIDYGLSVRDVYLSFAKSWMIATRSLDIICTPQSHCYGHGNEDLKLPAWVPDWRLRSPVNCFVRKENLPIAGVDSLLDVDGRLYNASRNTVSKFSFEGEFLICAGMLVDTVAHVSETYANVEHMKHFALASKYCHRDKAPLTPEQLNRQFWSMMNGDAGCNWEGDGTGERIRWINPSRSYDNIRTQTQKMPGSKMTSQIRGRNVIITEKGYMGLAPYWVEAGMSLAILLGCSMPVLLAKHHSHYHLKGDAFVQGWMNGELLDEMVMTDEELEQSKGVHQPLVII